ncbi:MAG: YlxR family protein [Ilumatobacteraceae bacterium]
MRTCVGCRATLPQTAMVRCVLPEDDTPIVSRTAPGRGAWLCSSACFPLAVKRRGFDRAWRRPVGAGALETLAQAFLSTTLDTEDSSVTGSSSGAATSTKG